MIHDKWREHGLEENLLNWFIKFPRLRHIPFYVIWGIWKYQNKILFENWVRQDTYIAKFFFFFLSRKFKMRLNLPDWNIS
jgi:hypothetical protein